jgi:hypothetical protein
VPVDQNPVLQDITWENTTIAFRAQWLPWPNLRVFAEYQHSNIAGYDVDEKTGEDYLNMFTPNYLHGKTNTLVMGFGYGFN